MPELPEVEFARRSLAGWAAGRRIAAVRLDDPAVIRAHVSTLPGDAMPHAAAWAEGLVGAVPQEPVRHGKRLGWRLGDRAVLAHLGMTGKWVRRPPGIVPRYARIGLDVGDAWVWFTDARRFGCLAPVDDLDASLRDGLGPDALNDRPSAALLAERLGGTGAIKVALLDQGKLAGIGNLHAAEVLWRAKIDPRTKGSALRPADWDRLAQALAAQLDAAIALDADEEEIDYVEEGGRNPFAVYDREGQPCLRCGRPVASFPQGGRTTFWCPACQRRRGRDSRAGRSPR